MTSDDWGEELSSMNAKEFMDLYHQFVEGDDEAARKLWQKSLLNLLVVAFKNLERRPPKSVYARDPVLGAFIRLIKASQGRRLCDINDQNELWSLVSILAQHKEIESWRDEDCGTKNGESIADLPHEKPAWKQQKTADRSREASLMNDSLEDLLNLLEPQLYVYAIAKLEDFTDQEIADAFGVAVSTVELKLRLIREIWKTQL